MGVRINEACDLDFATSLSALAIALQFKLRYAPVVKSWMSDFGQSMNLPIMCYFQAVLFPWWQINNAFFLSLFSLLRLHWMHLTGNANAGILLKSRRGNRQEVK